MPEAFQQLHAKLILCTSHQLAGTECDLDSPEYGRIHHYLVPKFRSAFASLVADLELLGYEVLTEFYVDTLDQDYLLSVGRDGRDEVKALVEEFHLAANTILTAIPDVLDEEA